MDKGEDEFEQKMLGMDIPLKHFISKEEKENSWKKILEGVERPSLTTRVIRLTLAVAAACGLIALGIFCPYSDSTLRTIGSEKLNVSLSDGSVVTLNRNSSLKLDRSFEAGNRSTRLQGEAFFNVKRDPQHPFRISIGSSQIEVLGTSFNVRYVNGEASISVRSGKVKVQSGAETIILSSGQKVFVTDDGTMRLESWDENDLAWYTGILIIRDKDLTEVASLLSGLFDKQIDVSPTLSACRISGKVKFETIADVLNIVKQTLDIEWKEDSNTIHVYGKGC